MTKCQKMGDGRRRLPMTQGKLHENLISPGGGIGRRVGLKIRLELNPVPVQVWPRAILKELKFEFFFITKY